MNKVVVIAGPTATGKTALSVRLAKELGGEVVSADSVQIYQGLNIGSAKPTCAEMQGVVHHMMDILSPNESFSVADFCARAKETIFDIQQRGKLPIVAGGTGLYISSLVENISFAEGKTERPIREELMGELAQIGKDAMYKKLEEIDPEAAKAIHPNNTKRVVRALEVYYTTGETITQQNARSKQEKSPFSFVLCALTCQRELLYQRINKRVDDMVQLGLFQEVETLLKQGIDPNSQSMQGIGYKEVVSYLDGACNMEECIEKIKQNSRNYAKRQLTWFRRGDYTWYDCLSPDLQETFLRDIGEKL